MKICLCYKNKGEKETSFSKFQSHSRHTNYNNCSMFFLLFLAVLGLNPAQAQGHVEQRLPPLGQQQQQPEVSYLMYLMSPPKRLLSIKHVASRFPAANSSYRLSLVNGEVNKQINKPDDCSSWPDGLML